MKKILKYMNFNVAVPLSVPRYLKDRGGFIGLILVVIFQSSISLAEVPEFINYQGRLTESGVPVTGNRSMIFRIYDAASGGNKLWEETRTVTINNGVFSIKLGEITPIPKEKFSGASTYLETQVGTVILGRERLVTVPYAYHSAVADSVSGDVSIPGDITLENSQSIKIKDSSGNPKPVLTVNGANITRLKNAGELRVAIDLLNHPEARLEIVRTDVAPAIYLYADGRIITSGDLYCRDVYPSREILIPGGTAITGIVVQTTYLNAAHSLLAPHIYGNYLHVADKSGFSTEVCKNMGDTPLHTGDLVKLSDVGIVDYWGKNNIVPISGVVISDTSEDTRVIGFVTGKTKGFKNREEIKEEEDLSTVQPGEYAAVVTLGAFAICKVDATNGPIKIGDLLTSSSNPSYAMKAKEPKIGTIIGKALQNLDSGTGTIGVLVGAR